MQYKYTSVHYSWVLQVHYKNTTVGAVWVHYTLVVQQYSGVQESSVQWSTAVFSTVEYSSLQYREYSVAVYYLLQMQYNVTSGVQSPIIQCGSSTLQAVDYSATEGPGDTFREILLRFVMLFDITCWLYGRKCTKLLSFSGARAMGGSRFFLVEIPSLWPRQLITHLYSIIL